MSASPLAIDTLRDMDRQSFVEFECRNRQAFEQFNRARGDHYYTPAGLDEAFDRLLNRQLNHQLHVWVLRHRRGHWLGRAILFDHDRLHQPWGLLAYQTDLDHCRLGVATQLVRQCVCEAVALGHAWLDAQVTTDNVASLAVLSRCGFQHSAADEVVELARGRVATLRLRRVIQLPHPGRLHRADVRSAS